MLLNEIINEVGMTKRAVKYYEEKGLLSVDKDNNGYRNYTAQDVETLKKISVYRKLGISIKDIQSLLETGDKSILLRIYQEKVQEKVLKDSELEALKQFIDDGDADKANEALDYQTVENAIESLLPGKEWGDYFKSHFKPFLNVRLKTLEQKQALQNILEYCDETTLKVPFIMGIGAKMIGGIAQETRTADEMIAYYRDMSESEYERLKEKVWKGAKMKNGIMKYHPAFIAQRKMQKELQNKGYNDIFIPNLMVLSPTYEIYANMEEYIMQITRDNYSQYAQMVQQMFGKKASSNDPLAQCDYGNFSLRFKPVDINFTKPNWDTIMTKRDKPAMSEEEFDEAIKELARKEFATGKRDDDAYRKLCMQHGETVSPDRKAIYESSMKKTGGKMNAACMFWDSKGNKTLSYNPESRNWKAISTDEEFARARVFTSIYNDELARLKEEYGEKAKGNVSYSKIKVDISAERSKEKNNNEGNTIDLQI